MNNLVNWERNDPIKSDFAHCASAASPVEGCLGLPSSVTERSCLEPTGNRSFSTLLKILQSWKLDSEKKVKKIGEGVRRAAQAVSKGTQVTLVKWYQGRELFLFPAVLSLTKSRWLGSISCAKVPLIHLEDPSSL